MLKPPKCKRRSHSYFAGGFLRAQNQIGVIG
nr:MAG TPA: hypothetical protein [Caudoviricetes sp.]